jgi:flavin-binding protein dodecin
MSFAHPTTTLDNRGGAPRRTPLPLTALSSRFRRSQTCRTGRALLPFGMQLVEQAPKEKDMAKKPASEGVYRVIDVIGTSTTSWEDAAKHAVETASGSLRDLRIAEVARLDVKIENGKVLAYRARMQLSFKYEE